MSRDVAMPVSPELRVSDRRLPKPTTGKEWNTRSLGLRFGADFASAAVAGALICPIITIIDRYVLH
jgi:hypothetical protein